MCNNCWCNTCENVIQLTPACPCPDPTPATAITSTWGTITVTHPWLIAWFDTWNVEKECCIDNKVSVDWTDTPAFLEAQLVDSPDDAITWSKITWPDGTKVMQPVLDQSKLNIPDQQVAAANWCTPWFLTETLTTNDNTYFGWDTSGCKTRLLTKPRKLFRAEFKCKTEQTYSMSWMTTWWSAIESQFLFPVSNMLATNVSEVTILSYTYYVVTIPRTAWYLINMQGSYTVSWAHTIRNQVWKLDGNNIWEEILDSREEWGSRVDSNANDLIDTQWELNTDIAKSMHSDIPAANWEELSISTFMRWHWFGWWTATLLIEWTKIMMWWKYNTIVKNTFTSQPETSITFTSRWTDLSTNGDWAGTWRSIIELAEFSLTD